SAKRLQAAEHEPVLRQKQRRGKRNPPLLRCFATRVDDVLTSPYPRWISSPGVSSACDDIPHTIPYHGGVCLSSASRSVHSYQPVAFRRETRRRSTISNPATRALRCKGAGCYDSGFAAGKRWPRVQTARAGGDSLRHI